MTFDLGSLVTGFLQTYGGPAAFAFIVLGTAYAGLKHLTGKWLDNRFAEKLKATEHHFQEQMKKVEQDHDVLVRQFQSSIDREVERASKVHAREFDVLAEAWGRLYVAYWRTRNVVSRAQERNDFTLMTTSHAEAFIDQAEALLPFAKIEIRALATAAERNEYYWDKLKWWKLNQCRDARKECTSFVDKNSIFMRPDIRRLFEVLDVMLIEAQFEYEISIPTHVVRRHEKADSLHEGVSLLNELEALIHDRLWSSALPSPSAAPLTTP